MKKLAVILLTLTLVFALAACGENSASTPDEAASSADSGAETEKPQIVYNSIEEYIASEDVATEMAKVKATLDDYITFSYSADGNTLSYNYTYVEHIDDDSLDSVKANLDSALEKSASSYQDIVDALKRTVTVDSPKVTLTYFNDDGEVITSKTFE